MYRMLFGFGLIAAVTALQGADAKSNLKGKRVAILVADGFEYSEMTKPRKALDDAGAKTLLIAPKSGEVTSWKDHNWGDKFAVDMILDGLDPKEFDALLLPGGVISPDALRMNPKAVAFVKAFYDSGKPIAAICHGPWTLVEADVVRGRKITSWPSLKTDIRNAGGIWQDAEVVVDQGIVTSRKPEDIPAFNKKMIEEFAEGKHSRTAGARR